MLHKKLLLIGFCVAPLLYGKRSFIWLILANYGANYDRYYFFIDTDWWNEITFHIALLFSLSIPFVSAILLPIVHAMVYYGLQRSDINWRLLNNKWSRINWRNGFYHLYYSWIGTIAPASATHTHPWHAVQLFTIATLRVHKLQKSCTIPGEILNFPLAYRISFRAQSSLVSRFSFPALVSHSAVRCLRFQFWK